MILTINRVYLQHFRTYIFEAKNAVGRVTREISLEQGNVNMQINLLSPVTSFWASDFVNVSAWFKMAVII
jgi:hypothetical protein